MRCSSLLAVVVLGALLASACDGGTTSCTPGSTQSCLCAGGSTAVQTCAGDGTWGACQGCPAGGDDGGVCGPGTCTGCCQGGACVGGTSSGACGASGGVCVSCGGGEMCAGGACVPVGASCPDPAGCPTGCCAGATCMPGNTPAACGGGGGSCLTCGGGETCAAGSCQAAGCSVRDLGSAIEDTCTGENICDCGGGIFCEGTGRCVPAFGRIYRIGVMQVSLPERGPDGMCWDVGCGAPDPFVSVTVDGTVVGTTTAGTDLFNVTWDPIAVFDANILAGSGVHLDVWDEDVTTHDGAFACARDPIAAADLRSRSLSCAGDLGSIIAVIAFIP